MSSTARDLEQQQQQQHRDRQAANRPAAQCRICATDIATDDDWMHIFAEDGRGHYLQIKIRKYLHILVSGERAFARTIPSRDGRFFFPPLILSLSLALPFVFFLSKFPLYCRDHVPVALKFPTVIGILRRASFRHYADRDRFLEIGRDRAAILAICRSFPRETIVVAIARNFQSRNFHDRGRRFARNRRRIERQTIQGAAQSVSLNSLAPLLIVELRRARGNKSTLVRLNITATFSRMFKKGLHTSPRKSPVEKN